MDGEDGAADVVGLGEQRGEFEFVQVLEGQVVRRGGFLDGGRVGRFVGDLVQEVDLFQFGGDPVESPDPAFVEGDFLQVLLGGFLPVPEAGMRGFRLEAGYGVAAGGQVKETP